MHDKRYPNLFLIGFPKCATTSMYSMLADHPGIFSSGLKKPDYFMKQAFEQALKLGVPQTEQERIEAKSREYPHQRFDLERYLAEYEAGQAHAYRLDASHYSNFKNVPELIRAVSPEAHFVAMVREPVQRFYSHYLMTKRKRVKKSDISFDAYLQECLELEKERKDWRFNVRTPLSVGRYHEYLQPYVEAFGKERVHVVRFEDFQRDRMAVYGSILRFLRLDEGHVPPQFNRSSGGRHRSTAFKKMEDFLLKKQFRTIRSVIPSSMRYRFRTALRSKEVDYEERMRPEQTEQLTRYYSEDQAALAKLYP